MCERLENGTFRELHAQLKGYPREFLEFCRMSISLLIITSLCI
jgi:hypothetical protein